MGLKKKLVQDVLNCNIPEAVTRIGTGCYCYVNFSVNLMVYYFLVETFFFPENKNNFSWIWNEVFVLKVGLCSEMSDFPGYGL